MKPYLYLLIAVFVWGFEYVLVKDAVKVLSPWLTGSFVFLVAASLLATVLTVQGRFAKAFNRDFSLILLIGLVSSTANMLWFIGSSMTSVANISLLGKADVLFAVLLSVFIFRESISKYIWISGVIMSVGILFVIGYQKLVMFQFGAIGDYLILGTAFMIALNAYIIKKVLADTEGIVIAFWNCFINVLCFSAVCTVRGEYASLRNILPSEWGTLILCGICSFIFFISYYKGLQYVSVLEVRLLCLGVPVSAIVMGWFLLGEVPDISVILGGILIISGAAGIIYLRNRNSDSQSILKCATH